MTEKSIFQIEADLELRSTTKKRHEVFTSKTKEVCETENELTDARINGSWHDFENVERLFIVECTKLKMVNGKTIPTSEKRTLMYIGYTGTGALDAVKKFFGTDWGEAGWSISWSQGPYVLIDPRPYSIG